MPYWLAEELTRKGITTLDTPSIYGPHLRDALTRGPVQLRTKDKSPYYFETGVRFAWLTKDVQLATALIRAIAQRMHAIVERVLAGGLMSEEAEAAFLFVFSEAEEGLYSACKATSADWRSWREGDARVVRCAGGRVWPKE